MELKAPATAPAPRLEEQPLDPLGPLTLIPDVVTGPATGVFGRVVCLVPRRVILTKGFRPYRRYRRVRVRIRIRRRRIRGALGR